MKKLLVLLFILSSFNSFSQKVDLDLDSLRFYMLELVNEFRTDLGFRELQPDSFCNQAAQNHSIYMAKNNVCVHNEDLRKPGFTGQTASDRGVYGENVQLYIFFKETPTKDIAKILFKRWKASPGHNTNMRQGRWRYFGFGVEVFAETEYAFRVAATQTFK